MPMPSRFPTQYPGCFGGDGCGSSMATLSGAGETTINPASIKLPASQYQNEKQVTWSQPVNQTVAPQQSTLAAGVVIGPAAQNPGNQINSGGGGIYGSGPSGTAQGGGMGQQSVPQGMPASLNSGPT